MSHDHAPHFPNPEQGIDPGRFLDLIRDLDPGKMVGAVAFREIAGPGLAKLFLRGYASHLEANPEAGVSGLSGDGGSPLMDVMCDIERSASYDAPGTSPGEVEARFQENMTPWRQAYTELTGNTPPTHFLPQHSGQ